MRIELRTINKLVMFGMASLLLMPQLAMSDGGAKYRVTIYNLTAGQPFTPPVLATHTRRTGIFSLGDEASGDVQMIAENGNNTDLVLALMADDNVHQVVEGSAPIVPADDPGGLGLDSSATFTIWAGRDARYLSVISMLICTNDGFTGLDTVALPWKSKTVHAVAYEARTEENTEAFADMVPPCQLLVDGTNPPIGGTGASDPGLAEGGVIIPHAGIQGGADLRPKDHDWGDPVAKIVIKRIRH